MGILEDILEQLVIMNSGASGSTGGSTGAKDKAPAGAKDKAPAGAKLEDVQDVIRELVAADADNKPKIKAAIKAIDKTAERAGDFESAPAKLTKLLAALNALKDAGDEPPAEDDDDML